MLSFSLIKKKKLYQIYIYISDVETFYYVKHWLNFKKLCIRVHYMCLSYKTSGISIRRVLSFCKCIKIRKAKMVLKINITERTQWPKNGSAQTTNWLDACRKPQQMAKSIHQSALQCFILNSASWAIRNILHVFMSFIEESIFFLWKQMVKKSGWAKVH